jgi:hypothetical protein
MEVPDASQDVGWFTGAPTPGALGPAIVVGHVTWDRLPAVFYRLGELRPGDVVRIVRRDRRVAVFTVTAVDSYPKSRFPTRAVYGATDHAGLRMITCGGEFDEAASRYVDNVVVFARLTKVVRA